MAIPNESAPKLPRPGPGRGNHRTGKSRGTKSGLRRGQLRWQDDAVVLERIGRTRELLSRGETVAEIAKLLEVSIETTYEDIKRQRELLEDRVLGSVEESLGGLRHVRRLALETFASPGATAMERAERGNLLSVARQTVMDEAKLLGQLVERQKVDVEATLHNGDRSLDLLRPEVRDRVEALYDALDGHADAPPAREADRGRVLALPPSPSADRASPSGGDGSA